MPTTRVLLIETSLFSHFVEKTTRQAANNLEVVGVVKNVPDALTWISSHKPDVIIVDLCDAGDDRLNVVTSIRHQYPHACIVGRTKQAQWHNILQAVAAGVMGFINDQTSYDELVEAVCTVRRGYPFLPQNVAHQIVRELQLQNVAR